MYVQNEVFETIEVTVHFTADKINILKFKWRNRYYNITGMRNNWTIPVTDGLLTCYTVISEGKIWELCYHHSDFKWELNQYDSLK
jgi:hypothetical protein